MGPVGDCGSAKYQAQAQAQALTLLKTRTQLASPPPEHAHDTDCPATTTFMLRPAHTTTIVGWQQDRRPVISKQEEGDGVRSGPGEAGTILLLHIISARPSKSSRYIWSSVPILFLQEQITDITITWWLCSNTTLQGDKSLQWDLCICINSSLTWATRQTSCTLPWPSHAPPSKWPLPLVMMMPFICSCRNNK
jgi:hypothetical protein